MEEVTVLTALETLGFFPLNSLILLEHLDFKCLLKHCKQISFSSAALHAVLQYILSTLKLLVIH